MTALGTHILLDLRACDRDVLNDVAEVRRAMLDAAVAANATIIGESFHAFSTIGVSGAVIISESHLTIHTWPEYGFAAVDIFTCGAALRPDRAVAVLIERLRCGESKQWEVQRGVLARGAVASSETPTP
jgi:S-adenosylmethionine decarboxylase proenzyme